MDALIHVEALNKNKCIWCCTFEIISIFLIVLILFNWISEIMEKLAKEGVVSKTGKDSYTINKQKVVLSFFPIYYVEGCICICQSAHTFFFFFLKN